MRKDSFHNEDSFEARGSLNASLEHVCHPSAANALEEGVFAELNRLRKDHAHDP